MHTTGEWSVGIPRASERSGMMDWLAPRAGDKSCWMFAERTGVCVVQVSGRAGTGHAHCCWILTTGDRMLVAGAQARRGSRDGGQSYWVVGDECDGGCRSRTTALTSIPIQLWHPERKPVPQEAFERSLPVRGLRRGGRLMVAVEFSQLPNPMKQKALTV